MAPQPRSHPMSIQFIQCSPDGVPRSHKRSCVYRAISIASGLDYPEVVGRLALGALRERPRSGKPRSSPQTGVLTSTAWFKDCMRELGFTWVPTMGIGTGCRVHLDASELPSGRLVVMVSRHACAVIDRVLFDNHDCRRGGRRCVYGFWRYKDDSVLQSTGTRERHLL
jgi:hypothetical protein